MPSGAAAGLGVGLPVVGGIMNALLGGEETPQASWASPGQQAVHGDLASILQSGLANMPDLNIQELLAAVQGARGAELPEVPTPGFSPEVQEAMRASMLENMAPGEEQARLGVKDLLGEYGPSTIGLQTATGVERDIGKNRASAMSDLEKYFQTTGFNQALQSGEANMRNIMFPVSLEQSLLGNLSGVRNNMLSAALDFSRPMGSYTPQSVGQGISQAFSGLGDIASEFGRGGSFEGAWSKKT